MTPYSAAAGGSFSSRASSRSAAFSESSGSSSAVEPLAQLVDLRLLGVALAELVLDRLQLLAEEELALALLHLRLDLRLDLRPELQNLELAVQDRRDLAQPLLDVHELEQPLLLLGLDAHRRGDQVAERARVLDVRGGELQLLRQVRDERDHAREEVLDVARQRLDLARLHEDVREPGELGGEIRLLLHGPLEVDALRPLDEDPQRSVGHADQLVDDRSRADRVEIVEAGRLDVLVLHRDECEQPLSGDDVVDQLDRTLLPDRERRHRLGEDDRLLERQHRQDRRQVDVAAR